MKILILGGTGILTTDISRYAVSKGYDVSIMNRGKRKYAIAQGVTFIEGDMRADSSQELRGKIGNTKYDVVFDALSFEPRHIEKKFQWVKGLCSQYIFVSSATVYKRNDENEIMSEKTPIGNEKWEYAYNKSLCELYIESHYRSFVDHYTIIRPYVTYNEARIPYALVPGENFWSILNRLDQGKPIVAWDGGMARCTITNAKDFAVAAVGLFKNENAYGQAFNIMSDDRMTWKDVIKAIVRANGTDTEIISIPTSFIVETLPEFKGILCGDKGTNMWFDNSKIKRVVPEFRTSILINEGLSESVKFLKKHVELHTIDEYEEERLDYLLKKYSGKE